MGKTKKDKTAKEDQSTATPGVLTVPMKPNPTKFTEDQAAQRRQAIRDVNMPENHDGVNASDLSLDQKNKVKHSVQNIFRQNERGKTHRVASTGPRNLLSATRQLSEIMAEKLKAMKQNKKAKKKLQ